MIIFYGLSEEFRKARNFFEKGLDKCAHLCYNIIIPTHKFYSQSIISPCKYNIAAPEIFMLFSKSSQ